MGNAKDVNRLKAILADANQTNKWLEKQLDKIPTNNLQPLHVGTIVKGIVSDISKLYSVVKVDSIKCILPTSEMTWSEKPRCNVKMHDKLEAVVVKIEDGQVMLSTKRLGHNPWNAIQSHYKVGDHVKVSVVNITKIGAFVELEPGLSGLIYKAHLSFGLVNNPNDFVTVGQILDAEILRIDTDKQRIELTRLPFLDNPWENVEQKYSVGQIFTRKIKAVKDYGIFVELEPDLDALWHRSQMNVSQSDKLKDLFNIGDSLTLEICTIDSVNHKLSMKAPSSEELK